MHPLAFQVEADLQDLHPTPQLSTLFAVPEKKPSIIEKQELESQVMHPIGQGVQAELLR